jgi:hypothetical protein
VVMVNVPLGASVPRRSRLAANSAKVDHSD